MGKSEIRARRASLMEIDGLRRRFLATVDCQVVRYSILPRGLAEPYLLEVDGRAAGYAGVWHEYFPNRITEVFALPTYRSLERELVHVLADAAGAKELEVQTNVPPGRELLTACATRIWVENLLFEAAQEAALAAPDVTFRRREAGDAGPEGDWVVERDGQVVGAGGWLTHYNPPYADIYMEVDDSVRRQGVGSYLVQELRRACAAAGYVPAARCDPANTGSRRALERGGMAFCGEILAGTLEPGSARRDLEEATPDPKAR